MATQKQTIYRLQATAQEQDARVSIRKNSYGEYEVRMRGRSLAPFLHFADSFEDAVATAEFNLTRAAERIAEEERALEAEYQRDLEAAAYNVGSLLATVGCRLEIDPLGMVTMYSPKTGRHSLNMTRGVRPITDLYAHGIGFAEAQTRAITRTA